MENEHMLHKNYVALQKELAAKNRELEIEVALERVRARTMGMQNSSDLQDTASILFQQVQALGATSFACGFNIWDDDLKTVTAWMAREDGISLSFKTSSSEDIFFHIHDAAQRGESLFVRELSGEELKTHYRYMATIPIFKDVVEKMALKGLSVPTFQIIHCAFFFQGYLMFITYEPVPEAHHIFKRFAKVFEQTYTRFLDLQKAEVQTREAEVELGLERVRARAMAMHHSEELENVVKTLSDKLIDLGLSLDGAFVFFFEKEKRNFHLWIATNQLPVPIKVDTPYIKEIQNNLIVKNLWEAIETGRDFINESYSGKVKNDYFRFVGENNQTTIPEGIRKFHLEAETWTVSLAAGKNSVVGIDSWSGKLITQQDFQVLKRFAKVFEQAYTRFLDLQKAEAQTREAQIEAVLEKVRSRSLAMHKSDELPDVVRTVFDRLNELDIVMNAASIFIFKEDSNNLEQWVALSGLQYSTCFHLSYFDFPMFRDLKEAREKGKNSFVKKYSFQEKNDWFSFAFEHTDYRQLSDARKKYLLDSDSAVFSYGLTKNTGLQLANYDGQSFSEREIEILNRFAKVFEQAYTRFLDLQKAEAQAREAQIEVSLERVRAKTMAMHSSEDVSSATATMFTELEKLGIENFRGGITNIKTNHTQDVWSVNNLAEGKVVRAIAIFNIDAHPFWQLIYKEWEKKKEFLHYFLAGKEKEDYIKILNSTQNYLSHPIKQFPDVHFQVYYFNEGGVWTNSLKPHSDEDKQIMKRFTSVFSLTFRRYQDLQKAEAQVREATIEAALEKVRSRSLAMHKADELQEVVTLVLEKLQEFDIAMDVGGAIITTYISGSKDVVHWLASPDMLFSTSYYIPYVDLSIFADFWEAKESGKEFFAKAYSFEEKNKFFKYVFEHSDYRKFPDDFKNQILGFSSYALSAAFSKNSAILIPSHKGEIISDKQADILKRFAKVFEQTYTRFLDLQRAEAQAKEAQIEAALERVRSRSLAMRASQELKEVVTVVLHTMHELGIAVEGGVGIGTFNEESKDLNHWISSPDLLDTATCFHLPYTDNPMITDFWNAREKGLNFLAKTYSYDDLNSFWQYAFNHSDYRKLPEELKSWLLQQQSWTISSAWFKNSAIYINSYSGIAFSDSDNEILKRFARVFEQAYVRFLDLQKAEAQAKEATRQASIERVRGEIASMRTVKDLQRITPLIWKELKVIGVHFIRCGVFIVNEAEQNVTAYLSAPDGLPLATLHLSFTANVFIHRAVEAWEKQEVYTVHWTAEEFNNWTKELISEGQIADQQTYEDTNTDLPSLDLHFISFAQGLLYIGNNQPLNHQEIDLVKSLAKAFSLAYARYEDFVLIEKAKQDVDATLAELKSTQAQLIQSEKMASLGELTAGIAHEIQNPLNFVNNFSEVNNELIDELQQELKAGKIDHAISISIDIKVNEQKINHHGKRADAIVKGMLQHSRNSTGVKEPTNINALADEYLRLSYHGLRAKDKIFNADFKTDFDESIGKINIIPQDIGRVLLNLFNNAFYAVAEKKKQQPEGYEPSVSVITKKTGHRIEISVKDNGNGIPQKVLDKIFQPFFTTKPTGQGTGLGLSLSYDIVKANGGELKVKTTEGKGTEFTIQLIM